MKKIVIIYGESGSGKSALKKAIVKMRPDYHEVVTSTTRPPREGEQNGRDYNFYTEAEMAKKIFNDEMAEAVAFRDWVYGTERNAIKEDVINIGIWNPDGVETLNDDSEFECLNIYIRTPDKIRIMRSLLREDNPDIEEIFRRYKADKRDFAEADIQNKMIIDNDGSCSLEDIAKKIIYYIDKCLGNI